MVFFVLHGKYVYWTSLVSLGLLQKRGFQTNPYNTFLLSNDTSPISVNIFNKNINLLAYVNIFT